MSYTITTWSGNYYQMDDVNALKLLEKWTSSDKGFPVNLGEEGLSSSDIRLIKKNKVTEADLPKVDRSRRLKQDNRTDQEQYQAARAKAESVRDSLVKKGLVEPRKVVK